MCANDDETVATAEYNDYDEEEGSIVEYPACNAPTRGPPEYVLLARQRDSNCRWGSIILVLLANLTMLVGLIVLMMRSANEAISDETTRDQKYVLQTVPPVLHYAGP